MHYTEVEYRTHYVAEMKTNISFNSHTDSNLTQRVVSEQGETVPLPRWGLSDFN